MWDNCCRRSGSASDLSRDTVDAYSPINRSDSPLAQVNIKHVKYLIICNPVLSNFDSSYLKLVNYLSSQTNIFYFGLAELLDLPRIFIYIFLLFTIYLNNILYFNYKIMYYIVLYNK